VHTKLKLLATRRLQNLLLLLGALALGAGFGSPLAAQGTATSLVNPTFTGTGTPDGWQAYPPPKDATSKIEIAPDGGVHIVDADAGNGLGIGQWVPVAAGHKYVATIEAKGSGGLAVYMIFLAKKPAQAAQINKEKISEAHVGVGKTPEVTSTTLEAVAPAGAGVVFVWIYSPKAAANCDVVIKSLNLADMGEAAAGAPAAVPAPAAAPAPSAAAPATAPSPAATPSPAPATAANTPPPPPHDNVGEPKHPNPLVVPLGSLPKDIVQVVDFETGDVSQASWKEGGRKNMSTDIVRHGKYALQIALDQKQHRSEITTQHVEPSGEFKYGWSLYFPKDFDYKSWFSIVTQWHTYGTGQNYKPDGGPPTSISIGKDGKWNLKIQYQDKDTDNCAHSYIAFGNVADDLGKWTDFTMEVNWQSPKAGGGYLRLYKNGVKVVDYNGPTWFEGKTSGPYFKAGIYRGSVDWKGEESKSIIYIDDMRVGGNTATLDDVDPAKQK